MDKYQVTSEDQRKEMSKILSGEDVAKNKESNEVELNNVEVKLYQKSEVGNMSCCYKKTRF